MDIVKFITFGKKKENGWANRGSLWHQEAVDTIKMVNRITLEFLALSKLMTSFITKICKNKLKIFT